MSAWEVGMDGLPLRTEIASKRLLSAMGMPVMESQTFGRNDCLIDSIMQSLQNSGCISRSLLGIHRDEIALSVRTHLQLNRLTASDDFEYLSHDDHAPHIFDYLLTRWGHIWEDLQNALSCEFTIILYVRFQK